MRIRFDGKTVAVSGAGHGFGRCIAETFAQRGARVFGCDLSAAELAETATAGVEAEVVDLSDRVAAAAWIARIEQTTGGAVDVLVNNAGGVAGQETRRNWGGQFVPLIATRFFPGHLRESGRPELAFGLNRGNRSLPTFQVFSGARESGRRPG